MFFIVNIRSIWFHKATENEILVSFVKTSCVKVVVLFISTLSFIKPLTLEPWSIASISMSSINYFMSFTFCSNRNAALPSLLESNCLLFWLSKCCLRRRLNKYVGCVPNTWIDIFKVKFCYKRMIYVNLLRHIKEMKDLMIYVYEDYLFWIMRRV